MIKQDFVVTIIKGSKSYVLTEFEFIVKGLVERGYNISSLERCFNRGIELGKVEKKENDKIIDNVLADDKIRDLLKSVADSLAEIRDDKEED